MSGQQIGTAVGFVAGFLLPGGPQLWAAIGGFIGGVIDPTEIKGPHIGDGPQQSSNEGVPIALILGTAGWVQGNIVQISERREVKKEDDGKGGPVVVTYEAHQDYCIMAAESCELRGSTIVGVLMVRVNGKIVYDMRSASNMAAENAKFLQHHKFYYGAEDQVPDPTMEAISGVGNTPAYRGVFTMVARDVNLTEYGGAIATYEFVLVGEGEVVTETTELLATPVYGEFANQEMPLVDTDSSYELTGYRQIVSGGPIVSFSAATRTQIIEYFSAAGFNGVPSDMSYYMGYSASTNTSPGGLKISAVDDQLDVESNTSVLLVFSEAIPVDWTDAAVGTACPLLPYTSPGLPEWHGFQGAELARIRADGSNPAAGHTAYGNCSLLPPESGVFPYLEGIVPLYIRAVAKKSPPADAPIGDPCVLGVPTQLPDSPGFTIDCDGNIAPEVSYTSEADAFNVLQAEVTQAIDGRTVYTKYTVGPVLRASDPANTQAFWEAAYDDAVIAGTMPAGLVYPDDYPENISQAYVGEYSEETITTQSLSVATAIERICLRGGLDAGDIDTADIDAMLQGYPIQADYNAADCIKPLLAYCSSFASEYDAQLHFHPYGEAIEIVIDPEDFIEGSDVTDDGSREQAKEYPRKLSVNSVDITQNYTVRPQYAYRTTPDVRAIGEETIQIPLCDTPDHTAQIAEIAMKVSYARLQGSRKFSIPYVGAGTYLQLVAGMSFALEGKRWVANRLTLEDGLIQIDAAYDRQSAYNSTATGVPALPPTPPVSTISGVTQFIAMNIPALRDQDDKLILYFAVCGLLPSWSGCLLQWSVDDGATWDTAIASMTQASVIGYLTATLADADAEGDDTTNELKVKVHGGELNSITYTQYLNELNPCAILRTDSTAELIQFLDADETDPGEYTLTTLARGRLGTEPSLHAQGARFCSLDSVYSLEIPSALRGRPILFRPVTFGTTPESNATYSLIYDPAVSQTELAPQGIASEIDGSLLHLTVYPRHRFGTSVYPVASSNMLGYHWRVTDGTNTAHRETVSPETDIDITGWSSTITVSVSQVNRFTGAGPAFETTI